MSVRVRIACVVACLVWLAPAAFAQEGEGTALSPEEFEARRRELRAAFLAATTTAEKVKILEEFERLGLEPPPEASDKGPLDLIAAARKLIDEHADHYGVDDPWWNLDPNHALPANVRIGGLRGRWKCNLFGGNALWLAGFDPPRYGNKGKGEYPHANQWYKWSDKYAKQHGNKVHFQMVAEVAPESLPEADRRAAVLAVLQQAQPGDFIMVDHPGPSVSDGGHTRIVVSNDIGEGEGTITSAMASQESALTRAEGLDAFTGEETIWILRPNKRRN